MAHVTRPVYMPSQHAFAPVAPLQGHKLKTTSDKDTDASSDTEADLIASELSSAECVSDGEHTITLEGYQTDDDMYHPVYHMAIPPQAPRSGTFPLVAPGRFTLPTIPQSPCGHDQMRFLQMSSPSNLQMSSPSHSANGMPSFGIPAPPAVAKVWSSGSVDSEPVVEKPERKRTNKSKGSAASASSAPVAASPMASSSVGPSLMMSPPSSAAPTPRREAEPTEGDADRTTVMLKNLPKGLSRAMLLELLEKKGFAKKCNFVYLPVEFTRRSCMGYAFVNLDHPSMVSSFWSAFEGLSEWPVPSSKICRVTWSSPLQGLSEHVERFRNSPLMHATVPDECRPILLNGGIRVSFPAPTKTLRAPRPRASRSMRPFWQGEAGDADTEA